jgi:hypothetical protein
VLAAVVPGVKGQFTAIGWHSRHAHVLDEISRPSAPTPTRSSHHAASVSAEQPASSALPVKPLTRIGTPSTQSKAELSAELDHPDAPRQVLRCDGPRSPLGQEPLGCRPTYCLRSHDPSQTSPPMRRVRQDAKVSDRRWPYSPSTRRYDGGPFPHDESGDGDLAKAALNGVLGTNLAEKNVELIKACPVTPLPPSGAPERSGRIEQRSRTQDLNHAAEASGDLGSGRLARCQPSDSGSGRNDLIIVGHDDGERSVQSEQPHPSLRAERRIESRDDLEVTELLHPGQR